MFRNQNLFQADSNDKIKDLPTFIKQLQSNWEKTKNLNLENQGGKTKSQIPKRKRREDAKWCKPRTNFCKVNFDGAVDRFGRAAIGYIIRDHFRAVLAMEHKTQMNISVLEAETKASTLQLKKLKSLIFLSLKLRVITST